jgi:hypothetical protein
MPKKQKRTKKEAAARLRRSIEKFGDYDGKRGKILKGLEEGTKTGDTA